MGGDLDDSPLVMKAVLDKALSTITRSNLRRADHTDTDDGRKFEDVSEIECASIEADDFLFSKNNVYHITASRSKQESSAGMHEILSFDETDSDIFDDHIRIPGFLFVTTRGSNFGKTLILNWAPNSSMVAPSDLTPSRQCDELLLPPVTKIDSNTCVSIDLCQMEMIRIFYRMDGHGFIMSGELVIKSKEQEFKVYCLLIGHNTGRPGISLLPRSCSTNCGYVALLIRV